MRENNLNMHPELEAVKSLIVAVTNHSTREKKSYEKFITKLGWKVTTDLSDERLSHIESVYKLTRQPWREVRQFCKTFSDAFKDVNDWALADMVRKNDIARRYLQRDIFSHKNWPGVFVYLEADWSTKSAYCWHNYKVIVFGPESLSPLPIELVYGGTFKRLFDPGFKHSSEVENPGDANLSNPQSCVYGNMAGFAVIGRSPVGGRDGQGYGLSTHVFAPRTIAELKTNGYELPPIVISADSVYRML